MLSDLVGRLELEADLRVALERGQLHLHYQPTIDLTSSEVIGFEALARWQHPQRGLIQPVDFIGVAEQTGLIVPLSEHVMLCAADAARHWTDGGGVAVNVSPRLLGSGGLPSMVERVLARTGLPAQRLTLELTETALFDTTPRALHQLLEVEEMGVALVLDDFGTGFSSLSHLRRVRVDAVKIDRTFIQHMTRPGNEQAIVRAVLSMAAELEIEVVAEGVETVEQAELLRELGCPYAQGFLFGHPAPVAKLAVCPWESRTP
jgi:EAL domain-containing protein (putative c-di-GMP-specific phosphodiesterase class I)